MMTKVIKLQAPARNRVQLCSKVRHDPRAEISDKEFVGCNNLGFYCRATTDFMRRLCTTLAQKQLTKNLWDVTIKVFIAVQDQDPDY